MRPINVSLDATTWELAKKKPNFSAWVRAQLRSERNKSELPRKYCRTCDKSMKTNHIYCMECTSSEELLPVAPVGQWVSTGPAKEEREKPKTKHKHVCKFCEYNLIGVKIVTCEKCLSLEEEE